MRLTTKGRYAVTALLDLSLYQSGKKFISISQIASRQTMPVSYLEQLFRNLRRAGIVESARGPGGGYRLSRPSTEINVSEVVASVEATDCNSGKRCLTHDLWTELNEQVDSFLLNKSLQDVIKNKRTSLARKQEGLIVTG